MQELALKFSCKSVAGLSTFSFRQHSGTFWQDKTEGSV